MGAYAPQITEAAQPTGSTFGVRTLTREDVMTAPEVAELLRMPTSTIYELARRGELPAQRVGRTWRFLRPRLEELFAS
jgi:excisionase family DNA binding protein